MSKLFGLSKGGKGKSNKDVPTTSEAIQSLRSMEEQLIKKQEHLERQIEAEVSNARKNAKTNKTAAMMALKRKKRYEKQLLQIDGTLTTLEQQREALDGASMQSQVLQAMGTASKSLKKAAGNMDSGAVYNMLDDIAESGEVAKEIAEAISNPIGFGEIYDDDELEAELFDLEAELEAEEQKQLDSELLNVGPTNKVDLPEVPSAEIPLPASSKQSKDKEDEDKDLEALESWAS